MKQTRSYLGDGLYADYDGYQFGLHANNGLVDMNSVYLDPEVLSSFLEFVERKCGLKITVTKLEKNLAPDV